MKYFQRLLFLYVLVIIKETSGKHSQDTSLPLLFSCPQLAEQVHLQSQFKLINVSAQAVSYSIHGKDAIIGNTGNCPCDVELPFSALMDESGELYITLFKKKDRECATKQLIKLKDGNRCNREDIAVAYGGHNFSKTASSQDRNIFIVDWQEKCDLIGPVLAGSTQIFKCDNIDKKSTTEWVQEFGNIYFNIGSRNTLTMMINKLDNNTAVVCYKKSANSTKREELLRIPIRLSLSSSAESIPSRTYYYNETSALKFNCETSTNKQYIFMSKDNVIKDINKYSDLVHPTFEREDTGTTLSCVQIILNSQNIEKFITKKEKFVYRNNLHVKENLPTDSLTELPVTSSTPEEESKPLIVGEVYFQECSCDSHSTDSKQLAWQHYFPAENQTFEYSTVTNVKKYIIKLTIGEFDNNTTLTCVSQNHSPIKNNLKKLKVLKSTIKDSHKNEEYYNEETPVECDCSKYVISEVKTSMDTSGSEVKSYLIQEMPDRRMNKFSHEKVTKMKFTKADNNSLLYCLCIVEENKTLSYEVTRHVKEMGLLIYQENKGGESDGLTKNSYFVIGGAIIGFIILAIISIACWKLYKAKKTASRNNNEDPARITYAELDLKTVPNNRRTLKVDETPYAEIVLYENESNLHCQTRADDTESPYANC